MAKIPKEVRDFLNRRLQAKLGGYRQVQKMRKLAKDKMGKANPRPAN